MMQNRVKEISLWRIVVVCFKKQRTLQLEMITHLRKYLELKKIKDILIEFLSLATGIEISDFNDIRIENNELSPQFYQDKAGRLDIKVVLKD